MTTPKHDYSAYLNLDTMLTPVCKADALQRIADMENALIGAHKTAINSPEWRAWKALYTEAADGLEVLIDADLEILLDAIEDNTGLKIEDTGWCEAILEQDAAYNHELTTPPQP